MTEDQVRIIQALKKAVEKLDNVGSSHEFQEIMRFIGALATHEAKKIKETKK